jgi:hypothetical protein
MEAINRLIDQGYSRGPGSSHQCGHCGAHLRYSALMVREDVKQYIHVGETCLDNRFELTKGEFAKLREQSRLNRERATRADRIANLCSEHPLLAWLTYVPNLDNGSEFLWSLSDQLQRKGELSERQIDAAEKAIVRDTERNDARIAREQAEALEVREIAPCGRVEVSGEVLTTKVQESMYGDTLKMLVKDSRGFKVWSSVPSGLDASRGDRVKFTATLTPSNDDPYFAYAKRPSKAELVS